MESQGAERRHGRKTWKKEMTQKEKESSERPHLDPTWKRRSSDEIMFAFWRAFEHIACQFLKNQHQICLPQRYIIGQRFFLDTCCPVLPLIRGLFSATLSFFLWTPWQEFRAGPTWKNCKEMECGQSWLACTKPSPLILSNTFGNSTEMPTASQTALPGISAWPHGKLLCRWNEIKTRRGLTIIGVFRQSYTHIVHMIASIVQGWFDLCLVFSHGSSMDLMMAMSNQTKNISITFV